MSQNELRGIDMSAFHIFIISKHKEEEEIK